MFAAPPSPGAFPPYQGGDGQGDRCTNTGSPAPAQLGRGQQGYNAQRDTAPSSRSTHQGYTVQDNVRGATAAPSACYEEAAPPAASRPGPQRPRSASDERDDDGAPWVDHEEVHETQDHETSPDGAERFCEDPNVITRELSQLSVRIAKSRDIISARLAHRSDDDPEGVPQEAERGETDELTLSTIKLKVIDLEFDYDRKLKWLQRSCEHIGAQKSKKAEWEAATWAAKPKAQPQPHLSAHERTFEAALKPLKQWDQTKGLLAKKVNLDSRETADRVEEIFEAASAKSALIEVWKEAACGPAADWFHATQGGMTFGVDVYTAENMKDIDHAVYLLLRAHLDQDKPRVRTLLKVFRERRNPSVLPGRALWLAIFHESRPKDHDAREAELKDLEKRPYFKPGMDQHAHEEASRTFVEDYRMCEYVPNKDDESAIRALFNKVPDTSTEMTTYKRNVHLERSEASIAGGPYAPKLTLPVIIPMLAKIACDGPQRFAALTGISDDSGSDEDDEQQERREGEYEAYASFRDKGGMCWDCGKPVPQTHPIGPAKCNAPPCKTCHLGHCRGVRGEACWATGSRPLKKTDLRNAVGKLLPERLARIIIEKQDEFKKTGKIKPPPFSGIRGTSSSPRRYSANACEKEARDEALHAARCHAAQDDDDSEEDVDIPASEDAGTQTPSDELVPSNAAPASVTQVTERIVDETDDEDDDDEVFGGAIEPKAVAPPPKSAEMATTKAKARQKPVPPAMDRKGVESFGMIDRGANVNVSTGFDPKLFATSSQDEKIAIGGQGEGQSTHTTCRFVAPMALGGSEALALEWHHSPQSRKTLIDEQALWRKYGARVDTPTSELVLDSGNRIKLYTCGSDSRLWLRFFMPLRDANSKPPAGLTVMTYAEFLAKDVPLDAAFLAEAERNNDMSAEALTTGLTGGYDIDQRFELKYRASTTEAMRTANQTFLVVTPTGNIVERRLASASGTILPDVEDQTADDWEVRTVTVRERPELLQVILEAEDCDGFRYIARRNDYVEVNVAELQQEHDEASHETRDNGGTRDKGNATCDGYTATSDGAPVPSRMERTPEKAAPGEGEAAPRSSRPPIRGSVKLLGDVWVDAPLDDRPTTKLTAQATPQPASSASEEACAAGTRLLGSSDKGLVWSARLAVSAKGLVAAIDMVDGIDIKSVTQQQRVAIDSNEALRTTALRRKPAPSKSTAPPPKGTASRWHMDGFGPTSVPSIVTGCSYQMLGCDVTTNFNKLDDVPSHKQNAWTTYLNTLYLEVKSYGHEIHELCFDRAGEFSPDYKAELEARFTCLVRIAASKYHEGVGTTEATQDVLNRLADYLMYIAGLSGKPEFFLPARGHASRLLNLRRPSLRNATRLQESAKGKSRLELMTGHRPDRKTDLPLFVFGCTIAIYREAQDRGPHGGAHGRAIIGVYLGNTDTSLIVRSNETGKILYPRYGTPLDEAQLVNGVMPRNGLMNPCGTQTIPSEMPAPRRNAEEKRLAPTHLGQDAYQNGTRLDVLYKDEHGKPKWYTCTVNEARPSASGTRSDYRIKWDDAEFDGDERWLWINIHSPSSPPHRLSKTETRDNEYRMANAPVTDSVTKGEGMRVLMLLGGSEDVVDNMKARILARYELAQVTIIDAKNDADGQDLTKPDVKRALWTRIRDQEWNAVTAAPLCGTFTPRSGVQYRSKAHMRGLPGLQPAQRLVVNRHDKINDLVDSVIEWFDTRGFPWILECSPDRTDKSTDAYWPSHAHIKDGEMASYWYRPAVKRLLADGAWTMLVAYCACLAPPSYQKYLQFMGPSSTFKLADEHLGDLRCTHAAHEKKIEGVDENGFWLSQQSEEYPAMLADRLAEVITRSLLPPGARAAPVPPFSEVPRTPTAPAYGVGTTQRRALAEQLNAAVASHQLANAETPEQGDAISDALHATADSISAQEAGDADTLAARSVVESAFADGQDIIPTDQDVKEVLIALKVANPRITRKQALKRFQAAGVLATAEQIRGADYSLDPLAQKAMRRERAKDRARGKAKRDGRPPFDAAKATQDVVDVMTPLGFRQIKIPCSAKQVASSVDCEKWMNSDRKALFEAILKDGNHLMPESEVPEGEIIAPCVTARKVKKDQATSELEKYKSRHSADGARVAAIRKRMGLPSAPRGTCNIADDMTLKCLLAWDWEQRRVFYKMDIGDAYIRGKRARPMGYMQVPTTLVDECRTEDGEKQVIALVTPLWGEAEAGFEWDAELEEALLTLGWRQVEGVPAMYEFEAIDGNARLVKIVDDLGISDSTPDARIATDTLRLLRERYDGQVTFEREPASFVGYMRHKEESHLQLSMREKIVEAVRKYAPDLFGDSPPGVEAPIYIRGLKLDAELALLSLPPLEERGKLDATQKKVQCIVGDLKYIERCVMPALTEPLHALSCVMSYPHPPDKALLCALSLLRMAYLKREQGLKFSRRDVVPRMVEGGITSIDMLAGAPGQLEITADAATRPDRAVYSLLLTGWGASIHHQCKNIGGAVASTWEGENVASIKASEIALYAGIISRALGAETPDSILVMTDNKSNMQTTNDAKATQRTKYMLKRQVILHARVKEGNVCVAYIPDPENPSDYLSKSVDRVKTQMSDDYATGAAAFAERVKKGDVAVAHVHDPESPSDYLSASMAQANDV